MLGACGGLALARSICPGGHPPEPPNGAGVTVGFGACGGGGAGGLVGCGFACGLRVRRCRLWGCCLMLVGWVLAGLQGLGGLGWVRCWAVGKITWLSGQAAVLARV